MSSPIFKNVVLESQDTEERLMIIDDRWVVANCGITWTATIHSFLSMVSSSRLSAFIQNGSAWDLSIASNSRSSRYHIKDVKGNDISAQKCPSSISCRPADGLLHSRLACQTLWWLNNLEKTIFGGVPVLCYLIAKIRVVIVGCCSCLQTFPYYGYNPCESKWCMPNSILIEFHDLMLECWCIGLSCTTYSDAWCNVCLFLSDFFVLSFSQLRLCFYHEL